MLSLSELERELNERPLLIFEFDLEELYRAGLSFGFICKIHHRAILLDKVFHFKRRKEGEDVK